jgi:putative sugar O-methyltransferase
MIKKIAMYFIRKAIRKVFGLMPYKLRRYVFNEIRTVSSYALAEQQKIEFLIGQAISASNTGYYELAEAHLLEAALLDPTNQQIAPHLGRVRFLKVRSTDCVAQEQNRVMLETISAMNRELESQNPIYIPSEFWSIHGKFHLQLLERYGIGNFKRTVSHYYQNWLMFYLEDPQVRQIFKTWTTNFSSEPWFNKVEVPDHVGFHLSLTFDDCTYPLADADKREIYRVAVGLLWEYVNSNDTFNIMTQLSESEIGNPLRIWRKDRLISSDIAHSVRERNMLLENLSCQGNEGFIVGELGAGHGRIAEVFGHTTNYRYYIFDITPALYVSQWYIKAVFPDERIFEFRHFENFDEIRDELQECRFAFFTANQIEKIPDDHLHIFINTTSLMEMRIDQIRNFLSQIDRLTTKAFLSRQFLKWKNPLDKISIAKDTFRMNSRWELSLDKVDDIYPDFFNHIWVRSGGRNR